MASTRRTKAPRKKRGPLSGRLALELCMGLALIALGALLLFRPAAKPAVSAEDAAEGAAQEEAPAEISGEDLPEGAVVLRLHLANGTKKLALSPGALWVPEEAPLEGYTFLRWQDGAGQAVPADGLRVWEDGDYYPVYAMRLGGGAHEPYLSLDENGAFHPGGTVTRREAVCILYSLLDTELVGDGVFLDVPEEDEAYRAAATLKTLGALSGSRLHPDETVTRREFLAMVCPFFPEETAEAVFTDLSKDDPDYPLFCTAAARGWIESGPEIAARPDEELTRMELVAILSGAANRHGDAQRRTAMVGTIVDVSQDDPHFWDVAEATLPHRHTGEGEGEHWSWSERLPLREEGLFFLGVELHAIDENGSPVINGEYGGLRFDENGIQTSGDPELDKQIRALLETLVDPATQEPEEMLNILFAYTVRNFRYRYGSIYPLGEPSGWEVDEALAMLQEGAGNCYSFAAVYCCFARAIGYDAKAYTGAILGREDMSGYAYTDLHGDPLQLPAGYAPHGWVEIEFDGKPYIFDPEYGYRIHNRGYKDFGFFKLDEHDRARFGYITELPESPSPAP